MIHLAPYNGFRPGGNTPQHDGRPKPLSPHSGPYGSAERPMDDRWKIDGRSMDDRWTIDGRFPKHARTIPKRRQTTRHSLILCRSKATVQDRSPASAPFTAPACAGSRRGAGRVSSGWAAGFGEAPPWGGPRQSWHVKLLSEKTYRTPCETAGLHIRFLPV